MGVWVGRAPSPPLPYSNGIGVLSAKSLQFQQQSKNKKKILNAIISYANTNSGSGGVLKVEEIKERSKKWQWKDQYSINYLVSSNPNSNSQSNTPLLLVHGFGASIPHWRRLCYQTL